MFGLEMMTKALIVYLDSNPEFKLQLENARNGLAEFVENSRATLAKLEAIEAQLIRIETTVSGGLNLRDDALIPFATANFTQTKPREQDWTIVQNTFEPYKEKD